MTQKESTGDMTEARTSRHKAIAWGGLGIALILLGLHANHFDFINDDAFISFRYADTLVRHGELTFNPGERVEGYTNFLWTLIIAAVLALRGDPVVWSKLLGVMFSAGTLVVLFTFTRWWIQRAAHTIRERSPLWACLAPILLAINPAFAAWSEGGLETAMFTFWVTAALLHYIVERLEPDGTKRPWSAALMAVAALTRPEGVLLFGLLGLHRMGWQFATERRFLPTRPVWGWTLLFVAIYLPYWLWRTYYYGYPFPNTYYAKGDQPLWEHGFLYVSSFIQDCHVWVVLPLMALPWRIRSSSALLTVTLAIVLPFMLYVTRVGGDFMALYRFLIPILPLLALVAQEGIANGWLLFEEAWTARTFRAPTWTVRIRAASVGVVLLALLSIHNWRLTERSLEIGSENGVDSIGWLNMFVDQLTPIGQHLRTAHPPDTSIAITAAGVVPYYSRLRTLDLLALNDVYTAHNVKAHRQRPGHAKAAPEAYVLKWKPDLLIWQPRLSKTVPRARGSEASYWKSRGYTFQYVKVPGLEPPYWSYYQRTP